MLSTRRPRSGSSSVNIVDITDADGGLAGELLAPADAVAAVDLDGAATRRREVAAAGRHEHGLAAGDPRQRRLGAGQAAPPAPRRERGDVVVHRQGQRGRAAVAGQLAVDEGDLADRGAHAAELGRHGEGQHPALAQGLERLGHPGAVAVVAGGVLAQRRAEAGGPGDQLVAPGDVVVVQLHGHGARRCAPSGRPIQSTIGTSPVPIWDYRPRRSRRDDAAMGDYNRYCPVSMGSDVIADRWTPLIVRELVLGNTRFNDIARGLPGHLPLAARAAPRPPRAHRRHRAVAVADRQGQRVPADVGRARTSSKVLMALGRWSVQWLYSELRPRDIDAVDPDVVDAPPRRAREAADRAGRRRVRPHRAGAHDDLDGHRPRRGLGLHAAPRLRLRPRRHVPDAGAVGHLQRRRLVGPRGRQRARSPLAGPPRLAKALPTWFSLGPRSPDEMRAAEARALATAT